jgi:hypothetical protein
MAKIKGALHSIAAHGSIANTITFCKSARLQTAKGYSMPVKTISPAQLLRRTKYRYACKQWTNMDPGYKPNWLPQAQRNKVTLFNAYMSDAMSGKFPVPKSQWDLGASTWDSFSSFWDQL